MLLYQIIVHGLVNKILSAASYSDTKVAQ